MLRQTTLIYNSKFLTGLFNFCIRISDVRQN
uniref:Uncharacterized protein n=1 Tax=Arundo donax TaxID=35708 RepID=A0A0A9FXD1_ARUDO